jgi:hypothetical protein
MNLKQSLIIAVDFDGTIVEDAYPALGKPRLFAFDTLKKLQNEGHRLILWTFRSGKKLEEAVKFCESMGISFYAINASYEDEEIDSEKSRKIHADIFIDDRNVGGFIGWGNIHQILLNQEITTRQTKGIFSFLKKR